MPRIDTIDYDDVFYTASLIEFVGRKTMNRRADVVQAIGVEGLRKLVNLADVNHCLPFEQVSDEVIERYHISEGSYDTVRSCKYQVPSYLSIGSVYAKLVTRVETDREKYPDTLFGVMTSGISDAISNFNSAFYFAPAEEIEYYYRHRFAQKKDLPS